MGTSTDNVFSCSFNSNPESSPTVLGQKFGRAAGVLIPFVFSRIWDRTKKLVKEFICPTDREHLLWARHMLGRHQG